MQSIISYEDIQQHNRCPRRQVWGSTTNGGYYKTPSPKAACATAISRFLTHDGDDALDEAVIVFEDLMRACIGDKDYEADLETGKRVIEHFSSWYSSLYDVGTHVTVVPDVLFELFPKSPVKIKPSGDAVFKIDGSTNLLKIVVSSEKPEAQLWRLRNDEEMNLALAIYRAAGIEFDSVMYIFVRFKAPCIPEVLKSGGLTKRANIDTTYEVYEAEILKQGLNVNDYRDILNTLASKPNTFFDVVHSYPTDAQIESTLKRTTINASLMMHDGWEKVARPYDPSWCNRCPFIEPCLSFERGENWQAVLDWQSGNHSVKSLIDWN